MHVVGVHVGACVEAECKQDGVLQSDGVDRWHVRPSVSHSHVELLIAIVNLGSTAFVFLLFYKY